MGGILSVQHIRLGIFANIPNSRRKNISSCYLIRFLMSPPLFILDYYQYGRYPTAHHFEKINQLIVAGIIKHGFPSAKDPTCFGASMFKKAPDAKRTSFS